MLEPPDPSRPDPERPAPERPVLRIAPRSAGYGLERLREHWDDPRVRVGALLVAALVAGFVWYQIGISGRGDAGATAPSASTATTASSGAGAPSTAPAGTDAVTGTGPTGASGIVFVHVAGAVVHPGVVRIRAGSRVTDAVAAAGGGLPDADLDRLNLAAKVTDGQRIAVAHIGAPAPVESGTTGGVTTGDGGATTGPVNLNTATEAQLEELPGIGPSLAGAILAEREKRGSFKSVGELQDVRGIGELRFADIKDLVSV
jgi:competence protein ComEA